MKQGIKSHCDQRVKDDSEDGAGCFFGRRVFHKESPGLFSGRLPGLLV